jgi:hypothetical protein
VQDDHGSALYFHLIVDPKRQGEMDAVSPRARLALLLGVALELKLGLVGGRGDGLTEG